MRIAKFRIQATITRLTKEEASIEHQQEGQLVPGTEQSIDEDSPDHMKILKEISAFNQDELSKAKGCVFVGEKGVEVTYHEKRIIS